MSYHFLHIPITNLMWSQTPLISAHEVTCSTTAVLPDVDKHFPRRIRPGCPSALAFLCLSTRLKPCCARLAVPETYSLFQQSLVTPNVRGWGK